MPDVLGQTGEEFPRPAPTSIRDRTVISNRR
ncbi:MAG: hypothetical protein EHM59_21805 [Betaproteobacteria bacterium]|nr:MAG: hypothetical protein EHM59_21805 [Betaproteobacteria bacterium]